MANKENFSGCTVSSPSCKCFEKLSKVEFELIESKSVYVTFKKGEILCKKGSISSHIMMIENGLVKVFLENGTNTLVLKVVTSGNLIGLSSIREGSNVFPYNVMAYIDTKVKQIDINTFHQVLSNNAAFAKEVIELLGSNSEQIHGRFFCLVYKQSYGRMADILLCMADRIFKNKEFELPVSRKDLAELTGLSSETVIRILKKFQDDGLIQMDGKSIKLIDYERLINISENG
jgi:CRP/FNR family transcriptional regulator